MRENPLLPQTVKELSKILLENSQELIYVVPVSVKLISVQKFLRRVPTAVL